MVDQNPKNDQKITSPVIQQIFWIQLAQEPVKLIVICLFRNALKATFVFLGLQRVPNALKHQLALMDHDAYGRSWNELKVPVMIPMENR